eukprot:1916763-Rhodomonas_salina.2
MKGCDADWRRVSSLFFSCLPSSCSYLPALLAFLSVLLITRLSFSLPLLSLTPRPRQITPCATDTNNECCHRAKRERAIGYLSLNSLLLHNCKVLSHSALRSRARGMRDLKSH